MGHTLQLHHIHNAFSIQATIEIFGCTYPAAIDPNHRGAFSLTMGAGCVHFRHSTSCPAGEHIVSLDIP
jgi:hypothetical protein